MLRQWPTHRLSARGGANGHWPVCRPFHHGLGFGSGGLQIFELQLQLVEHFRAPFCGDTELLSLQLGDQQLQMGHHRLGAGRTRFRLPPRGTFRQQRRLQCINVVWQVILYAAHIGSESYDVVVMHAESLAHEVIRPVLVARFVAGSANRCLRAYSRVGQR
jgi:hypothetical protein